VLASTVRGRVITRLVEGGIPRDRILREDRGTTTREQMVAIEDVLRERQIDGIVLVASPIHMPRALGACRAVGIRVVPSVSPRPHADLPDGGWSWVPRLDALRFSSESLYEYAAEWWYQQHGWVA
jgi:uncharacterized SAM-binding protein YcdF (DUF218 family)